MRAVQLLRGAMGDTMLQEEPLEFMRLGLNLERAGMTTRILDVSYHLVEDSGSTEDPSLQLAGGLATLRSCSGMEAFFKRGRSLRRGEIASFVLQDPGFSRSVLHCLERAEHALGRVLASGDPAAARERTSPARLRALRDLVQGFQPSGWTMAERHAELTRVVDDLARLCDVLGEEFFGLAGGAAQPPAPSEARSEPATVRQRTYRVVHSTAYGYDSPIQRSTHMLRLRPVQDRQQELLEHELSVAPVARMNHYGDVFANEVASFDLDAPYEALSITATSVVRVHANEHRTLHGPSRRSGIPLVWMPWQRQMMTPYLLPHELPETQLRELFDYAMGFVERQDYDLTETLLDINGTIYRDYAYVPGATTVETTPYEVYVTRRGVCQDFANLLICLARLLGVPARYRVGYIHTSKDYENTIQSDASHAWAELYLPWYGWQGFDPTNGSLAGLDHVRVACGRNYRDATPTSGTIFQGGGGERLAIDVRVELMEELTGG